MIPVSRSEINDLVRWWKRTYRKRSLAIRQGDGRIDWIDPGTRVSWTEVVTEARRMGITADPVTLWLEFEHARGEDR